MQQIIKKNQSVLWKEVDGEMVLMNPKTGSCFGLQAVGASFWQLVDGTRTLGEIIDCLLGEYTVEKEVLTQDINELMTALTDKNLILAD